MNRIAGRLTAALFAVLACAPVSAQVVISQVYGGGGNAGATLKSDFIELHNNGAAPVDLNGWSVQYTSSAGTSWQRTALAGSIAPGGYYLIKQADGTGGTTALPTPDATGTIPMSGTAGKVALVNHNTALSGACPTGNVDFVGFGSAANCAESSAPTANLTNSTAAIRSDNGCVDSNNNSADFAIAAPTPRNSASAAFLCGGGNLPVLTVADVSLDEGNSGPTAFVFTLQLSQPAGAGGVAYSASTVDGTATAGSDYAPLSQVQGVIAEGHSSATVTVDVQGDANSEANETFQLRVQVTSGGLPAPPSFAQATGTIVNDDVAITPIHDIQGPGATSPLAGQLVTTTGIVTGRKSNGFFLQGSDAEADADPATSEGVFVFVGAAPPAAAAVGNRVRVTGTVIEFVPGADPGQAPLTEIGGSPSVSLIETGVALPVPQPLPVVAPDGPLDALERFEGMRVSIASFTVASPTDGNTNESNASGSSNGIFNGVQTGTARPFREPGIQAPDSAPGGGSIPPIPRWDFNPELLTVDSDAIGHAALNVSAGTVLTGLTGPLDFGFRRYTLLLDAGAQVGVTPGPTPRAAAEWSANEAYTVAGYNLERFFDDVNDPAIGEPVLTQDAFQKRLGKASLAIRDYLRTPDIVGLVEVENLQALQALANRIDQDATSQGQAAPLYQAYLVEGNDVGGIDVGFLVKGTQVPPGMARVQVNSVTQIGKDTTWTEPSGGTSLLNDRPPLALDALVHFGDGRSAPVSVVLVHQRSLNGAETNDAEGNRIRQKRQRQAEFLATYLQQRQTDAPDTRLIVLGDFNAFEFNDGLVDAMNVVTGTPSADNATAVAGDGADLVNPDLINLATLLPAAERYSFVFGGNAQSLDHVLANEELLLNSDVRIDHARINADFPEIDRNDALSPSRLSDHDPVVVYVTPRVRADLAVSANAEQPTVQVGQTLPYFVALQNRGPENALAPAIGLVVDAEIPALNVEPNSGTWTCDAPQVDAGKTSVACSAAWMGVDQTTNFAVSAVATPELADKQLTLAAASSAQSIDPVSDNNQATASIQIVPDPNAGSQLLVNGETVAGLNGTAAQKRVYRIDVPAGARNLRIISFGGTGEVSLYAKLGSIPDATQYDLRSTRPGNNEAIATTLPQAGTWFITLVGERAFERVSIRASFVE